LARVSATKRSASEPFGSPAGSAIEDAVEMKYQSLPELCASWVHE